MEALKIDQRFIRGIRETQESVAFVKPILEMANTLGMVGIAEGVETTWHHECLRDLGADFVQGYNFSKTVCATENPRPAAQFGLPIGG